MKIYHVNTGRRFSQPYESKYATLRRCLVANPGLSMTNIEFYLRNTFPGTASVVERIRNIEDLQKVQPDIQGLTLTYKRQCPMCAELLFHTDIYALPWLIKCPIHHCALTYICPSCHLPWPDKNEITKRECPTCGALSFRKLYTKTIPGIQSMTYAPIKVIHDFIDSKNTDNFVSKCSLVSCLKGGHHLSSDTAWWRKIDITNPLYSSFKLRQSNYYSSSVLDKLCIHHKIHCQSSNLIPSKYTNYDDYYLNDKRQLKWLSHAMIKIVSWINSNTSISHQLHIMDYSYLYLRTFKNGNTLCPFCVALSIWFFAYAPLVIDGERLYLYREYDFLEKCGFVNFYDVGEPRVILNDSDYFRLDERFTEWFYQRGLIISFLDILKHIITLKDTLKMPIAKKGPVYYADNFVKRESHDDQLCSFMATDDRFYFYYEVDDVLNAYLLHKATRTNNNCKSFQRDYKLGFRYNFSDKQFTNNIFSRLISAYREYHIH